MTKQEQLDDIEELVNACLSYVKTLRTDATGQNKGYKAIIEGNWTKIEEILLRTDILLPEPNIFNTLYVSYLFESGDINLRREVREKYDEFKRLVKKVLGLNIKKIEDLVFSFLFIILVSKWSEARVTHKGWIEKISKNFYINSKDIFRSIKYIDLVSISGRKSIIDAICLSKGIDIQTVPKKQAYGLAVFFSDILGTATIINLKYTEFFVGSQKELRPWLHKAYAGAGLRSTVLSPLVSKIIDVLGIHNIDYIKKIIEELLLISSIVKNSIKGCIRETPINKVYNNIIKLIKEDQNIKIISYYFDHKFYYKILEEIVEYSILYNNILWTVDLKLLLGHSTLKIIERRDY